jgi:acyl-CoA synthetase (NDP forming)
MINEKLINPGSIVVVGGSNDISKPGGKVLKNLIEGNFSGSLYAVNPRSDSIQGVKSYSDVSLIPECDLAIIAIPATYCLSAVKILATEKSTRAFIILSAGFGEESPEGKVIEKEIADYISNHEGCLIGPNCIGILNTNYHGVFTAPIPGLNPLGVDLISGSGATAVFIMESAITNGLTFSGIYSVGNGTQVGVEDVVEYLDTSYISGESSKVKLLYIENIEKPEKLLKHSVSLIRKGCRIAAIKAGSSEAGSRAAASHTGALSTPDLAVDALFRKAGIIRCHSRINLVAVASILMSSLPEGRRLGVITHAGGPAVMLTDALSDRGIEVPPFKGPEATKLREKLYPGSSVANPVDFLATGTASQLEDIINTCENDFDNIDAMAVIFGNPGLTSVSDVFDVLDKKIRSCRKPLYPILPSVVNAKDEIEEFVKKGNVFFPDEVIFADALTGILNTPVPEEDEREDYITDRERIRRVIESASDGYLEPLKVAELLDASGIPRIQEKYAYSSAEAVKKAVSLGYPVVLKIIGPLHKTDVGGVALNISDEAGIEKEFKRMQLIPGFRGVVIQKMVKGSELFAGVKLEGTFGHILMAGIGGMLVEVIKDVSNEIIPVSVNTARRMIRNLQGYDIIKGVRGKKGINESLFIEIICRLSALIEIAPEITEMDINPLIGTDKMIIAVDARIGVRKSK